MQLAAGRDIVETERVLAHEDPVDAVAGADTGPDLGLPALPELGDVVRIGKERTGHADHVDQALGHGMDGGRGIGDAGGMQDRNRDLGADGGGKLEIGCRGQPHGRPDFGARLVVDGGAADDADEVDEARGGVGAGDLEAVLLVQAALEPFRRPACGCR